MFLLIEEEFYSPKLAFSFFYYFHIHWFDKHVIVIHERMGVIKGVVHIYPTTQPLLLQS